jgi:hypothetical protein
MTHLIRNFIYIYLSMIPQFPSRLPRSRGQTRLFAKLSFRQEGKFGTAGCLLWGICKIMSGRFGDLRFPRAANGHQPNLLSLCHTVCCMYYLKADLVDNYGILHGLWPPAAITFFIQTLPLISSLNRWSSVAPLVELYRLPNDYY